MRTIFFCNLHYYLTKIKALYPKNLYLYLTLRVYYRQKKELIQSGNLLSLNDNLRTLGMDIEPGYKRYSIEVAVYVVIPVKLPREENLT